MKKIILLSMAFFLFSTQGQATGCGIFSSALNLDLPSISYGGTNYRIQLDYYYNDGTNFYFKFKSVTLATSATPCGSLDSSLNISVSCADLSGTKLSLALSLYQNPDDKNGLYWKLAG